MNVQVLKQLINNKWPLFEVIACDDEKYPSLSVGLRNDYTDLLLFFENGKVQTCIHHGNNEIKDSYSCQNSFDIDTSLSFPEFIMTIIESEFRKYMEADKEDWRPTLEMLEKTHTRDMCDGSHDYQLIARILGE